MNKLKVGDPETFQFASVVIKDSKTGFSSNRRLLVVRAGHLYYYSTVPSFFDGDPRKLQYHHELPKHSLQLVNIKRIKPNQMSSGTFQIVFDENYLLEREDIKKAILENVQFKPRKKGEETTWKFTCDNSNIKQKWVSYLAQLKEYFQQQANRLDHWPLDNQSISSTQSFSSKAPWREITTMRKQHSMSDIKTIHDPEFDQYLQPPRESSRLTGSYVPQGVSMETFGLQAKELSMTDPGLKKEIKMKKMGSNEFFSKKVYY